MLLLALACFGLIDTLTKLITLQVPVLMVMWVRFAIQAVVTSAVAFPLKGRAVLRTSSMPTQMLRGGLLLVINFLAITSLTLLPVGEFTAIAVTSPLLVTLLAARVLNEHVSWKRIVLVIGGFLGTLVIVRPGSESFTWILLMPVVMVILNAGFQLLTSKMSQTEESLTIHFYTVWFSAIATSLALFWIWTPIETLDTWLALFWIGLGGSIGHLMLVMAFERAGASVLMPYMYLQIGFGLWGGWWVFGHVPDALSFGGIALIAVCGFCGALLTRHEAQQKQR